MYFVKTDILKSRQSGGSYSLSGLYGFDKFPFHTDGVVEDVPPKLLELIPVKNADTAKSLIIDLSFIKEDPSLLRLFSSVVLRVRYRKNISKYIRLYEGGIIRYDPTIVSSADKFSENGLKVFRQLVNSCCAIKHDYRNGSLMVNNWMSLHGRDAVKIIDDQERIIMRNSYYVKDMTDVE